MNEFIRIEKFFRPLTRDNKALGLLDDVAILSLAGEKNMLISKDMLIEGVHFTKHCPAKTIAMKALGVNLSDLASKGAKPTAYMLGLALPKDYDDAWLAAFFEGLKTMQDNYDFHLLGGDTIASTDHLLISITIFGEANDGWMQRQSAQIGDDLYVSGVIGDACLGLTIAKDDGHQWNLNEQERNALLKAYRLPEPRIKLGQNLAHLNQRIIKDGKNPLSAMDVSDGLLSDALKLVKGHSVVIEADKIPFSKTAHRLLKQGYTSFNQLFNGGDDYEILFTAPQSIRNELQDFPVTRIGKIIEATKGDRLIIIDKDEKRLKITAQGYDHFQ